jgi:hypothetical protein
VRIGCPRRAAYESSPRRDACSARRDAASARRSTGDRRSEREVREGHRAGPEHPRRVGGATLEDRSFAICRRRGTKRRAVQSAPLAILGARRSFFSSRATRDDQRNDRIYPAAGWPSPVTELRASCPVICTARYFRMQIEGQ